MSIYSAARTTGQQYDGVGAATGRFSPARTGERRLQIRINSIAFATSGAITSWALAMRDPSDGSSFPIDSGTTASFVLGGPAGFMLLPTNDDSTPWEITLVTVGAAGSSNFKIDYDSMATEQ